MKVSSDKHFGFGKYRGRRVDEVASFDPHYIWWVENNTEYRFTPRVKRIARFHADNRGMSGTINGFY